MLVMRYLLFNDRAAFEYSLCAYLAKRRQSCDDYRIVINTSIPRTRSIAMMIPHTVVAVAIMAIASVAMLPL